MGRSVFIHGRGNKVPGNINDLALINCIDYEPTEADEGRTIVNSGALIIDENGTSNLTPGLTQKIQTASFIAGATGYTVYFVSTGGGNIGVTLQHTTIPYVFIRTTGGVNTLTLTPESGLINGAASVTIDNQYDVFQVWSDGTDFYYLASSSGTGTATAGNELLLMGG